MRLPILPIQESSLVVKDAAVPLPTRDGVSPSFVWLPHGQWPNVLAFLLTRFPDVASAVWLARMKKSEVVDQHGEPLAPDSPCRHGMRIFYYREIEDETPIPFAESILYRDEHILVADKPHFLPVIPGGRFLHQTLLVRLKKSTGLDDLVPIHRLDRETAGVVIFCHNKDSRGKYQALFREHAVDKEYEALAPTLTACSFPLTRTSRIVPGTPFFCMQEAEGEPNAQTDIDVIEVRGELTLYRLRPKTGKTHQLRLHMAALGAPIRHDGFYPQALPCKGDDFSKPLQLLARAIAFCDPVLGTKKCFKSHLELLQRNDFPYR
ncbi:MAG: pseudouridine synthase [Burkholderiales bacterium]|nr:pseudouridine synthase [Burkholderiales bacterium]